MCRIQADGNAGRDFPGSIHALNPRTGGCFGAQLPGMVLAQLNCFPIL